MRSLIDYKSYILKLFGFILFFFVLLINVNAEEEPLVKVTCKYGVNGNYVVVLTDEKVTASANRTAWATDSKAITPADFLDPDGNYICKDVLYYKDVVSGRSASVQLSYKEKDPIYNYIKFNPLDLVEKEIIDNRSSDPDTSYKTCSYGDTIAISYNDKDVKISTTINAQMLAKFSPSTFANGCPPVIYSFVGVGYHNLSFSKSPGWSEIKLKNLITDYEEKCSYDVEGGSKISILTDGNSYFVDTWFECDSKVFEKSEMKYGCLDNLYYEIVNKSDGKTVCYFTFDESKGYKNVVGTKNSDGSKNYEPINCSDFVSKEGTNMIQDIFNLIMLIAPILVIVLGGLDFAKASLQSDENAIKKAGINFGKRLIAAVLLFLLPLIISLILEIAFDVGVLDIIPEVCID